MEIPPRFNVTGIGVHALRFAQARELILARASVPGAACVCFCDANSITHAHRDPQHRERLAKAFLVTPDGMPLVWLGNHLLRQQRKHANHAHTQNPGVDNPACVERVYGPDMMLTLCEASLPCPARNSTGLTHFFYGGGEGTAALLAQKLAERFPTLRVAGFETPPFREHDDSDLAVLSARLNMLKPNFIWIGLSTPKQEKLMAQLAPRLKSGVLLGVGAAFDFLSGRVTQAPRWMQRSGLEWLHRLCAEPRRLAPRYFKNNPLFAARILAQITGLKKYPMT